jgi:hypothetical protein
MVVFSLHLEFTFLYMNNCYIFQLKEYQQKGRDNHPIGIKTSESKITSKPQIEGGGGSLEQDSVFDSGPKNSEHNKVCSTVNVVQMSLI